MTRILIVEDEFLIGEDLKSTLEGLGHEVVGLAPNCFAALEVIWASNPEMALVDTEPGGETCEAVLDECARLGIPVIISSGHVTLPHFAAGLPFLSKPFRDDALRSALETWEKQRGSAPSMLANDEPTP